MNVDLLQASFQQRCERGDKLKAVSTTGRWSATTPTGQCTERWAMDDRGKDKLVTQLDDPCIHLWISVWIILTSSEQRNIVQFCTS